MTNWSIVPFVVICLIAVLAWTLSPKGRTPRLAIVIGLALMAATYAAALEVVGRPKPASLEWRAIAGLEVAGIAPSEDGQSLYVWVMRNGVPVSYILPMPEGRSAEAVAEILDHWRRRQQTGEQFFMGDSRSEGTPMKIRPPAPMPQKN